MRKTIGLTLIGMFLIAFAAGAIIATVSTVDAKPQCIATFKCINSDTYRCVMCPPLWIEQCTWHHAGCP